MGKSIIIFLSIGFGSAILSFLVEGGHAGALLVGTAGLIVVGGTIGAVGVAFPMEELKRFVGSTKVAFKAHKEHIPELIVFFKKISLKSRKDGLMSIEQMIAEEGIDPFVKKGLQMVVDGVDYQNIKGNMELVMEMAHDRHKSGIEMYEAAGGFAPTMGIIGTVMGLVHILGSLEDPSGLGSKIAVAFIATLYGVGSANLLYLPISARLKKIDHSEAVEKSFITEAILSIQEGISPNVLEEKLKSYLDKETLKEYEKLAAAESKV